MRLLLGEVLCRSIFSAQKLKRKPAVAATQLWQASNAKLYQIKM